MFSRAIRFLLVVAAIAVLLIVALSGGSFTSLIPDSLKEKITSIVSTNEAEAEAEAVSAEEPIEVIEATEATEEVEADQQPSEEIESEQADTIATATIEREE